MPVSIIKNRKNVRTTLKKEGNLFPISTKDFFPIKRHKYKHIKCGETEMITKMLMTTVKAKQDKILNPYL